MTYGLTEGQAKVFDAIKSLFDEKGYSPSIDEIAERCGNKAKSAVYQKVRVLRERGLIGWRLGHHRSMYLTAQAGLPPDIEEMLSAYCARTGESRSAVIADAVRLHLDEIEQCEHAT